MIQPPFEPANVMINAVYVLDNCIGMQSVEKYIWHLISSLNVCFDELRRFLNLEALCLKSADLSQTGKSALLDFTQSLAAT